MLAHLINFNTRIDPAYKHPGAKEANSAGKHKAQEADKRTVSKVQHVAGQAAKRQLADPVEDGVEEDIHRACTGGEEGAPLPVVVFGAQEKVDHQDCDGGAGDDLRVALAWFIEGTENIYHNAVADEEETEHVIEPVEPDRVHDEVQLNKDGAEWENTNQKHARYWAEISDLRWNLAGDLVCPYWWLEGRRTETKPTTGEGQRHRDHKPNTDKGNHSS